MERLRWLLRMKTKGFTLLECAVALFVLSIMMLSTLGIFKQIEQTDAAMIARNDQDWHVFLIQMENKMEEATFQKIQSGEVRFKNTETKQSFYIHYNKNQGAIALRVNGGYEPLLSNLSGAQFKEVDRVLYYTITFDNGEIRDGKWAAD